METDVRWVIPNTIDEAEKIGWDGLIIYCRCRITSRGWKQLRLATRRRALAEIAPRLRGENCRHEPERVALVRQAFDGGDRTGTPRTEELRILGVGQDRVMGNESVDFGIGRREA